MRSKKALKNTITSMIYQLVSVICGLIVPRLILVSFGSTYNGITSSITQFLQCASLLVAGVGGVTRAALYKPLAAENYNEINSIVNATATFMRKTAVILTVGIGVFACFYPFLVDYEFEWFFSFSLVLILGISTIMQYYFGITYQLLLMADQKYYVVSLIQIFTTVLNTVMAIILLKSGFGIHLVKLASAFAFSLNPVLINIYVRKFYKIDRKVKPNNKALAQRWDAFGQSFASFIHNNTDVIVLTIFADIKEVSVYTVYNYVISNIRTLIVNFIAGFGAAFGNMLAKGEYELDKKNLRAYELIIFNLSAIIYTTAGIMIVPFALLYTHNISDVNYARPIFAIIFTAAGAFSCFRIPYQTIVEAEGHFKQTRNGALIEAGLNIIISVIAVIKFGLVGVAVGTLIATVFRSIQYAIYLSNHLIERSIWIFLQHVIINITITVLTFAISKEIFTFEIANFLTWAIKSFAIVCIAGVFTLLFNLIFYYKDFVYFISKINATLIKRKIRKKS